MEMLLSYGRKCDKHLRNVLLNRNNEMINSINQRTFSLFFAQRNGPKIELTS